MKLGLLALLALAMPLGAAPQLPTIEPFLPEQNEALVVIRVDKQAAEMLSGLIPLDPAVTKKVLDEHFDAFSKASGIRPQELTSVFGGLSGAGATQTPALLGAQLPLELDRVTKMLKATAKPEDVQSSPDVVTVRRGPTTIAFLKDGWMLAAPSDQIAGVLKRKGPAPSNAAFSKAARARGADTASLFLLANVPPGALPPLPDHPLLAPLKLDPKVSTHLTSIGAASDDAGLKIFTEFDDAASAGKLTAAVGEGMKFWHDKAASDLAAAETKAAGLGVLGYLSPDLLSARMGIETQAYFAKAVTATADGKLATIAIPREMLRAFRGAGTIATLAVGAAVAFPALKQAQGQGMLPSGLAR